MKGVVLLLVIWVLALLSILAAVFISTAQSEKEISKNFTEEAIAKSLAQSGIEYGMSKIHTTLQRGFIDQSGNMDSFWTQEITESRVDGLMKIKIGDLQGRINVNDGVGYPKEHSLNKNLERMLNILGDQPTININQLGKKIMDARPIEGFHTEYDVERILGQDYIKVALHITPFAWKNNKVANPVPISSVEDINTVYPIKFTRPIDEKGNIIYRRGHNINNKGERITTPLKFYKSGDGPDIYESAIFSYDTLNPQWIEIVSRSPVNLNTATREVLTALISDLQGFYVRERRIPAPVFMNVGPLETYTNGDMTGQFLNTRITYKFDHAPEDDYYTKVSGVVKKYISDDHLGILQVTLPFSKTGLDPAKIADKFIELRQGSFKDAGFDNAIKTWAQFNLFADHLVQIGLIKDIRSFNEFFVEPGAEAEIENAFKGSKQIELEVKQRESAVMIRIAAQAMADVLKANFNPNLHLNELNPNHNIHLLVDKTDLLVNSTEFCFLPMGYFQIESKGEHQIDGTTRAVKTVKSVIKKYDVYYDTTQKDFYSGQFGQKMVPTQTNNGYAVETGPEPDNGKGPQENDYSGYISLTTNLGVGPKVKGGLVTTHDMPGVYDGATTSPYPDPGEGYNSDLHVHFQLDHVAHYHKHAKISVRNADNPTGHMADPTYTLPVGPFEGSFKDWLGLGSGDVMRIVQIHNYPDREETTKSPYSPVNGNRYRLCRTFGQGATGLYQYEPSDLRVDGAYCELNSAVSYHFPYKYPREAEGTIGVLVQEFLAGSTPVSKRYEPTETPREMFISFYVKPNFTPESSERLRQFTATNLYGWGGDIALHGMYWLPAYQSQPGPKFPTSFYSFPPPTSLVYTARILKIYDYTRPDANPRIWWDLGSFNMELNTALGYSQHIIASPMNYEFDTDRVENFNRHYGLDDRYNNLRKNEWIHVMLELKKGSPGAGGRMVEVGRQYINGKLFDFHINTGNDDLLDLGAASLTYTIIGYGPFISLGGECMSAFSYRHPDVQGLSMNQITRYYFADSTIDEFYMWVSNRDRIDNNSQGYDASERILSVYGRYYKPIDTDLNDGTFTSKILPFKDSVTILGASWTVYAENYVLENGKFKPVFYNYHSDPLFAMSAAELADPNGFVSSAPCIVSFETVPGKKEDDHNPVNNHVLFEATGFFANDGYSAIHVDGKPFVAESIKYKLKFRCGIENRLDTTLMATPIFDDITIFYTQGQSQIFAYSIN